MSEPLRPVVASVKGQIATERTLISKYLCLVFDADSAVSSGPGYRGQLVPRIYVMTSQKFLLFFKYVESIM